MFKKFKFSQNLHKNSNMEKEWGLELYYPYTPFSWFRLKTLDMVSLVTLANCRQDRLL